MRSVTLTALGYRLAKKFALGLVTERDRQLGEDMAVKVAFRMRGKQPPRRETDAAEDPYFGIRTNGRAGRRNLALQMQAFAETPIGKRSARGRARSNPMTHPERRKQFDESVTAIAKLFPNASEDWVRDMARRKARTVPVAKKARAA